MQPILLVVPREAAGSRLDRFLAATLSAIDGGPSRSELQRWIEHGAVEVDGVARKASDKLREGARVTVRPERPPRTEAVADADVVFRVVYMDDDVIVVDKPAGLVVHPAKGHHTGTLVNGLLARGVFDEEPRAEHAEGEVERSRPGIVHRLDKGTSGAMVVARNARAREHLKAQFAAHTVDREYVALAASEVREGTFDTLHGRHPTDRVRFSSKVTDGKRAVTHVRPLERFGALATYVACRLETGRTHQIRVHLADHGTPILGDALYGKLPKHPALREIAARIGRPALHARLLGFTHPTTGERVRFEAEPPADFALALAALRSMPTA